MIGSVSQLSDHGKRLVCNDLRRLADRVIDRGTRVVNRRADRAPRYRKLKNFLEKKTMKKTIATFTLALVTVFGATFAQAGIIVTDAPSTGGCTDRTGIIVTDAPAPGIIVTDLPGIIVTDLPGIIVTDLAGIIVTDSADKGCTSTEVSRTGIIVTD